MSALGWTVLFGGVAMAASLLTLAFKAGQAAAILQELRDKVDHIDRCVDDLKIDAARRRRRERQERRRAQRAAVTSENPGGSS